MRSDTYCSQHRWGNRAGTRFSYNLYCCITNSTANLSARGATRGLLRAVYVYWLLIQGMQDSKLEYVDGERKRLGAHLRHTCGGQFNNNSYGAKARGTAVNAG